MSGGWPTTKPSRQPVLFEARCSWSAVDADRPARRAWQVEREGPAVFKDPGGVARDVDHDQVVLIGKKATTSAKNCGVALAAGRVWGSSHSVCNATKARQEGIEQVGQEVVSFASSGMVEHRA